jgi:hypothetical protein
MPTSFDETLGRELDALADSASEDSVRALEVVLGRVVEAYGRALQRREDGTVSSEESLDGSARRFPVELGATAVMLTADRLLEAADLDIFELALWHHMGRGGRR